MKVKNLLGAIAFAILGIFSSTAQEKTISGTVVDQDQLPLPGVSVIVEGTTRGTQTDFDGNFSIDATIGQALLFTYIGQKQERRIIGEEAVINIQMVEDAQTLEEVVVTAQGIQREARALGYAVTTIDNDQIEQRTEADVARILNGKIAGVNITNNNGLSGSGTNIIIRGFTSVTQSNQPLFIVDGVPFDSGTNTQSSFLTGNTESSRFLDLDPNNIEKVNVLKGLSATVLYGSRGRNGVILITTKNASTGLTSKKTEVTVSHSTFFNEAVLPDYQDNYGGGFHQGFGYFFSNWGPRFDRTDDDGIGNAGQFIEDGPDGIALLRHPFNFIGDQTLVAGFEDVAATPYAYVPYNSVENFFRTGSVNTTSINIRGGGENTNFNASYGRTDDQGFVAGNRVLRNNIGIGGNAKLSNKITVSGSFNFARTDFTSPPVASSLGSGAAFGTGSIFGDVLYTPRSIDLLGIPFQAADGRSVYYRSGNDIQHPLWTLENVKTSQDVDRFNGTTSVNYEINDWLNVSYRFGLDTYTEQNFYGQNRGGVDGDVTGLLRTSFVKNTIFNHDLILSADKNLNDALNLKVILGGNSRRDTFSRDGLESTGQLVFGVLRHFNFTNQSSINSFSGLQIAFDSEDNQAGIYLDATLGYKDYLFLNVVGRNDWTSTLESENNSIFYPGASISFVPTDAFAGIQGDFLNYLKLRFGFGSSAGFPPPFNTRDQLVLNSRAFVPNSGGVVSSNNVSNTLGNRDLQPELVREFELGVDTKLFNRLNLNVSLFDKTTDDLITSQSLDDASGFTNTLVNIGEIKSKGIEVDYSLDIIQPTENDGFAFNISGNFSAIETTVTDLADGSDNIALTTRAIGAPANFAVEGRPFGVILGSTILRDDNGNPIVGNNGRYQADSNLSEIGDPNPDWTTALIPTISYKGFTLSANIQYRHGGDISSFTAASLLGRGVVDYDDPICRECNYILPGVFADGSPNNVAITSTNLGFDTYFAANPSINEFGVFDGTTIRLQEVSLGYSLPRKLLDKTPFGSLSFTLSGLNLWYDAINFDDDLNYDTNSSSAGVGNGQGIDFISGPSSRRYGLSVKASF
ncbi:MAG: SusC/RagA family TonB-linked outer membrane protein [Bacteroidota bacterium]